MISIQQIARTTYLKRVYSTASNAERKLIYTSPQIGLVKLVKRLSLTTLGISSVSTPAAMYFWDSLTGSVSLFKRILHHAILTIKNKETESILVQTTDVSNSMFLAAMMASVCSTGALSFLLSPYVNSIYLETTKSPISPNTTISIETLDLLARKRTTTLQLKDLLPITNSALLTWNVNKKTLERQYLLEQMKGIEPKIKQHRFWLDQRNGMGDREAMSSILRVVQEQARRNMI